MRNPPAACATAVLAVGSYALTRQIEGKAAQVANVDERRRELQAFNAKFLDAQLRMDTPAILQ